MANMIRQTVTLNASPEELFSTYLDSKKHAAVIGDKVAISRKVGARFTAFGGMLRGRNLVILPNRVIVQSWRAKTWKKRDADSILILQFRPAKGGGQIDLVHLGMPDYDYRPIKQGWPKYYWNPWKTYLKKRRALHVR